MLAGLLLASPWQVAQAAGAGPKSKVVQALITAAQKEFDAGNFDRAGELFLEIYRQDPETRAALYNAARAYQLAGKIDKADELFHELMAIADLEPTLKTKAAAQVDGLLQKRGERKADEADRAEKAGQYGAAAGLWGEAVKLAPAKTPWLLRYARTLHLAGQGAAALEVYNRYLAATPEDSSDRAQVKAWRDELAVKPVLVVDKAKPVEPAVEPKREPVKAGNSLGSTTPATKDSAVGVAAKQPPPSRTVPYSVIAGGAVAVVLGGAVLGMASSADADLQKKFDTTGQITLISHEAAEAEASRISRNYAIGWALTGVGLVGAGVGTWLLLRAPDSKLALVPQPGGFSLAGRF